ncbi:hypothetical protein [Solibacillus sp. CAU 1738]|uniref:hypothetical protein n=1 Tax=Solibacillus sp. CAU 1738 TaxID=3140363 RepID=UPI003260E3A5
MFYTPIFVTLIFLLIHATVSIKGIVLASFGMAALYTLFAVIISPYFDLVVICYLACLQFWIMAFATRAMCWR